MQPRLCALGFQPKNPSNTKTKAKLQNNKSNILACFKTQNYVDLSYINILKHIANKETKQTTRLKQIREKTSLELNTSKQKLLGLIFDHSL